jgi:hypothetical protein
MHLLYALFIFLGPFKLHLPCAQDSEDAEEYTLLQNDSGSHTDSQHHAIRTAPIITRDVLTADLRSAFSQRGLLGSTIAIA